MVTNSQHAAALNKIHMNRFLFISAAFLLQGSCISVNTASRTLDAGTIYRTWQLDEHSDAYLGNGYVFIKTAQCDQRKNTPIIGAPMSQVGDGSQMKNVPGTEKTSFFNIPGKKIKTIFFPSPPSKSCTPGKLPSQTNSILTRHAASSFVRQTIQ